MSENQNKNYVAIQSYAEFREVIKDYLNSGKVFGFDIEAGYVGKDKKGVALQQYHPDWILVGFSFTDNLDGAYYVPVAHNDTEANIDNPVGVAELFQKLLHTGLGVAHNCFTGDTEIITKDGLQRLDSLANKTATVWTEKGWVEAPVFAYGKQKVYELEFAPFNNSRTLVRHKVKASANHRWITREKYRSPDKKAMWRWAEEYTETKNLEVGDSVPHMRPPMTPNKSSKAFIHGLIFADGAENSRSKERHKGEVGGTYQIRLCGAKAKYKDLFPKYTFPPSAYGDPVVNYYESFDVDLKAVPTTTDPQYICDFIAGWAEFDGHIDQVGSIKVSNTNKSNIDWLLKNAAVAGYYATGYYRGDANGSYSAKDTPFYYTATLRTDIEGWVIKSITELEEEEEVYCPSVPAVERFTLGAGIYTANCNYELNGLARWFRETGVAKDKYGLFPFFSDTMIEAELTQLYPPKNIPGGVGNGLKPLVNHIFGHEMTNFDDLFEEDLKSKKVKKSDIRFNTREVNASVIEYACEDALWCLALHLKHYSMLKDTFIYKLEMQVAGLIPLMEFEGLTLDWKLLEDKYEDLVKFQEELNEEVQEEFSERLGRQVAINLSSSKQVADVLFDEEEGLGLTPRRFTDSGAPSTDAKALALYAKGDPTVKKMLEFREVRKLNASYLKKYLTELNYDPNGKAHPNHRQVGAGTGRFSVDGVSYQQWPKSSHYKLKNGNSFDLNFRDLMIAPEGFRIIGFDFAQVELRFLAGLAGEDSMIRAFDEGVDLHKFTASVMFRIPIDEVSDEQRQVSKSLGFGLVYGSGPKNLAEMLTSPDKPVSVEMAASYMEEYLNGFPKLRAYFTAQHELGRRQGYIETHFGRKYMLWEYTSPHAGVRASGDRMTVNVPCQGGSADMLKAGMVRAQKKIDSLGWREKAKLVMTVHDALEFYVHESISTQDFIREINPCVSFPVNGFPEFKADWHEAVRYGTEIEIEVDSDLNIKHYEYGKQKFDSFEAALDYIANPPTKEDKVEEVVLDTFRIRIEQMPTRTQFGKFVALVKANPGNYPTVLETPEGEIPLPATTFGTNELNSSIKVVFPNAQFGDLEGFDMDEMMVFA